MKVSPKVFAEVYQNQNRGHEFFYLFSLMFDVTVAKQIVERDNVQSEYVGKEYIDPIVGAIRINEKKVDKVNTDEPLIAVLLEVDEGIMFLVIDGYHRIAKLRENEPEEYNVYTLSVEQSKEVRII